MTPDDPEKISEPTASVESLLREIDGLGADRVRGGYSRPVYSTAERELAEWFGGQAESRGLDVETDGNGVVWAWWYGAGGADDRGDAVVTGSHLDSVPGGGRFDGPLGVASALIAVDRLRARGFSPEKPLAITVFPEEEGSRFGVACLGSRLMTGAIDPDRARALRDENGDSYADVATAAGLDARFIGRDEEALTRIGCFVELHVEQGRGLIDLDRPVAIGSSILGHGRWRITVSGQGNHAGTTLMHDRSDPMIAAARIVVAIRDAARRIPDARATVGRIRPTPGGTNVIASKVEFWLDARHPDDLVTAALIEELAITARSHAAEEGCSVAIVEESYSGTASFDGALRTELSGLLPGAPVLDTGAGHDAGVLSSVVPTAMLFVRNPSGISHSPEEYVEPADSERGAEALADVLEAKLAPQRPAPAA